MMKRAYASGSAMRLLNSQRDLTFTRQHHRSTHKKRKKGAKKWNERKKIINITGLEKENLNCFIKKGKGCKISKKIDYAKVHLILHKQKQKERKKKYILIGSNRIHQRIDLYAVTVTTIVFPNPLEIVGQQPHKKSEQ